MKLLSNSMLLSLFDTLKRKFRDLFTLMSKPLLMVYIFTCHVKNQWNLRYGSIRAGDYSVFLFSGKKEMSTT